MNQYRLLVGAGRLVRPIAALATVQTSSAQPYRILHIKNHSSVPKIQPSNHFIYHLGPRQNRQHRSITTISGVNDTSLH